MSLCVCVRKMQRRLGRTKEEIAVSSRLESFERRLKSFERRLKSFERRLKSFERCVLRPRWRPLGLHCLEEGDLEGKGVFGYARTALVAPPRPERVWRSVALWFKSSKMP